MKCDFCNKNEASISLIKIIDSKIEKINVCTKCIKKLTLSSGEEFVEDVADMLSKIFEVDIPYKNDLDEKFFKLVEDLGPLGEQKCSFCKIKLSTVKKIGKLGCYKCYDSFREGLKPLIKTIHGSIKYKGKMPVSADENIKLQMEIQRLKGRLDEEIVIENFEEAAKIRDTIGKLKKRLDSGKKVKRL